MKSVGARIGKAMGVVVEVLSAQGDRGIIQCDQFQCRVNFQSPQNTNLQLTDFLLNGDIVQFSVGKTNLPSFVFILMFAPLLVFSSILFLDF